MDIKEYILSGAIESYVLGLSSVTEMQEVETLAAQHPEINQAIFTFEEALEKQALASAVAPSPLLKQRVMDALAKEGMKITDDATPAANLPLETDREPAKVISITAAPKSVRWLRGAIAASIILLLGSAILNFYFYSQYKKYSTQYSQLLAQNGSLLSRHKTLEANYNKMTDTAMVYVSMKAQNPAMAGSVATVFWDSSSREVWLMVNNLPKQAPSKQYQLWALVDGKPVDAGVFDPYDDNGLIRMKNIPNAQAFAVTLENRGGSPTPTMDQMYVFGKV